MTYEVESPEDGVLGRILIHANETVPVGAVVAYIAQAGESMPLALPPKPLKPARSGRRRSAFSRG